MDGWREEKGRTRTHMEEHMSFPAMTAKMRGVTRFKCLRENVQKDAKSFRVAVIEFIILFFHHKKKKDENQITKHKLNYGDSPLTFKCQDIKLVLTRVITSFF